MMQGGGSYDPPQQYEATLGAGAGRFIQHPDPAAVAEQESAAASSSSELQAASAASGERQQQQRAALCKLANQA